MILKRLTPHPLLAPHIEKMWVFESDAGIPAGDLSTVVPNTLTKMIVSYRGSLTSSRGGKLIRVSPETSISFIGPMEGPVTIGSSGPTGSIGVEFKPSSAYRFFPFAMHELRNRVELSGDVLGRQGSEMQLRVADCPTLERKLAVLESCLLDLLHASDRRDPVVEWAVGEIHRSAGMVSIADVCRRLGYSRRYVDMRFADHVGLAPKKLAGISRFHRVFLDYAIRDTGALTRDDFADPYYDQSHFIREFKRFAGLTPRTYLRTMNEFGEIFYRGSGLTSLSSNTAG